MQKDIRRKDTRPRKRVSATQQRNTTRQRNKRRRRKKKSRLLPVLLTIVFILLIGVALAGYFLYQRYSYGTERADLGAYFPASSPDAYPVFYGGEPTETEARRFDGVAYLTIDDVHAYVSNRFYYGEADGIFVFTTPTEILTSTVGSNTQVSSGGETRTFPYVISRIEDGTLYVAVDYVASFYNVTCQVYTEPNHINLYTGLVTQETALITKDTALRVRGGIKSEILKDLEEGTRVIILDESLGDWIKVRTEDAFTGYVESKRLSAKEPHTYGSDAIPETVYPSISKPYKICLGWHQIGGPAGNDTLEEVLQNAQGVNTISPTWFALSDNAGNISSFGSTDYVERAHNMGIEVWALVSNFANEGIDVQEVLSHAAYRARLVDNLINEARRLSIDGINVDFEEVPAEAGRDYIQFIRELSIACRREQLVLSIDNYVPYGFNDYYDRREQGIVADYVIIMGYDEHYGGSQEAGSVASIEYVRYGIEATIAQVPAEKVINGVPFYMRVWTTSGGSVSSIAIGMAQAPETIREYGFDLVWDDGCAQYYGEVTTAAGNRVQIWVEDKESIEAKIAVMRANNIAGIAGWRLGLDSAEVWDVIAPYCRE